ncbi:MAG: hypothetical protein LBG95_00895 [Treponema sp.]|nr:hypothetical protein [Treponema sp.]
MFEEVVLVVEEVVLVFDEGILVLEELVLVFDEVILVVEELVLVIVMDFGLKKGEFEVFAPS